MQKKLDLFLNFSSISFDFFYLAQVQPKRLTQLVGLLMGLVTVKLNNTIISTNSNAKGVVTATKGVLESVVLPTNQPESTTSGGIRGSSHRHPPWL